MLRRLNRLRPPIEELSLLRDMVAEGATLKSQTYDHAITSITDSIKDYPSCPKLEIGMDEFQERVRDRSLRFKKNIARVANLKDGIVVHFRSKEFLESRMHELYLPRRGQEIYKRHTVDINIQSSGTYPVELYGKEEILDNNYAISSLEYCAGALAVECAYGWKWAFTLDDLNRSS